MPQAHMFPVAEFRRLQLQFRLPKTVDKNLIFRIQAPLGISAAYSGGESTPTILQFAVVAQGANPPAAGSWDEIAKDFSSADGLSTTAPKVGQWTIPYSKIQGKDGGVVYIYFNAKSTSTGPNLFALDFLDSIKIDKTGGTQGFSFLS